MGLVALATATLLAHVQSQCLGHVEPASLDVDIVELGVAESALEGADGAFTWEGNPCGTAPILHLGFSTEAGPRRLTVRPRIRAHRTSMQPVTVVVQRGALRLETPGTLLQNAVVGQTVKVRNDASRATLTAVLVTPDLVEVP